MNSVKQLIAGLAMLLLASGASAVPLTVDGGWSTFSWEGTGVTPFTFELDVTSGAELRVTDSWDYGDQFRIDITNANGYLTSFTTSVVDKDLLGSLNTATFNGDAAWADTGLSHGSISLGTGNYTISIFTIALASNSSGGDGFISAVTTTASVPEAGTLMLLAMGLLGLGFARRKAA